MTDSISVPIDTPGLIERTVLAAKLWRGTNTELGLRMGIEGPSAKTIIGYYRNGRRRIPSFPKIQAFASAVNVPWELLLNGPTEEVEKIVRLRSARTQPPITESK